MKEESGFREGALKASSESEKKAYEKPELTIFAPFSTVVASSSPPP